MSAEIRRRFLTKIGIGFLVGIVAQTPDNLRLLPQDETNEISLALLAINPARYEGKFVYVEGFYKPQTVYHETKFVFNGGTYMRRYYINDLYAFPINPSPSIDVRWEDVFPVGNPIPPAESASDKYQKIKVYGKVVNGTLLKDRPHWILEVGTGPRQVLSKNG